MSETTTAVDNGKRKESPDVVTIRDWFDSLGGGAAVRIRVYRDEPRSYRGKKVAGLLTELNEFIDEAQIAERWRGGRYTLKAFRQDTSGKWLIAGQRTVEIAGDPLLSSDMYDGLEVTAPPAVDPDNENPGLASRAMDMTARQATEDRRERVKLEEELRNRNQFDPTMIKFIMAPLEAQLGTMQNTITELQRQIATKDDRIVELQNRKPDTTRQDSLIDRMYDGESARLETLRLQHSSEIRQKDENNRENEKRLRDAHDQDLKRSEAAHERELHTMRDSYRAQITNLETVNAARIEGLQNRGRDVERDLTDAKKELSDLRAKKEMPMEEQLARLATIRQSMADVFGPNPTDEPEQSVAEQILDRVSPILDGIGARIGGGSPTGPQQLPPEAQNTQPPRPRSGVSPQEVGAAIQFIENAARNNTDPVTFASSARGMIPGAILDALGKQGVDKFLDAVNLPEGSILQTQAGRNWARKVAKALTEVQPG